MDIVRSIEKELAQTKTQVRALGKALAAFRNSLAGKPQAPAQPAKKTTAKSTTKRAAATTTRAATKKKAAARKPRAAKSPAKS